MVAIGVLMVATLSAFASQVASFSLMNSSRETVAGAADLQACMEQVLLMQHDEIPVPGSPFEDGLEVAVYSGLNLQDERIVPSYPGYLAGQPVPDPLPIVLRLDWNDDKGRPRSLTLRSLKVR